MNHAKGEWWDFSVNVVTGCTKLSAGCDNCFAEGMVKRKLPGLREGSVEVPFSKILLHPSRISKLYTKKPKRIALNWLGDLFHHRVPFFGFIDSVYKAMFNNPHNEYFVLTKRADRMKKLVTEHNLARPWIWHGVSAEDQETYDKRATKLLSIQGPRFVHLEPLLEPTDLMLDCHYNDIDWVVAGAEKGPKKRKVPDDWFRQIRNHCKENGVPFYLKTLSSGSRILDGQTHDELGVPIEKRQVDQYESRQSAEAHLHGGTVGL